jgi:hypothetical protein
MNQLTPIVISAGPAAPSN